MICQNHEQKGKCGLNENRCTCCGEVIPEGRMVCPRCETSEQQYESKAGGTKMIHWLWLIPVFVFGSGVGMLIAGLLQAGSRN